MKAGSLVAVIVLVCVLVVGLLGFGSYVSTKNHLVELNQDVETTYSNVDIMQQRRLDLIPNLVASVKGYVGEEQTVLTNIANARGGGQSGKFHSGEPQPGCGAEPAAAPSGGIPKSEGQ